MKKKTTKKNNKINTRKNSKKKYKNSILNYDDNFTKEELNLIKQNLLINEKSTNLSEKEILFNSGFGLRSIYGHVYFVFDPLQINTICFTNKLFTMLAKCIETVISTVIKKNSNLQKLINKKFKRFLTFINVDKDPGFSSDVILQLKIFKMILNENIEPSFKLLKKKKIIKIINDIIYFRNQLSHQMYKKYDIHRKETKETVKRSRLYQNNKLRNFNYVIDKIKQVKFLLNDLYKNKKKIKLDARIFQRNFIGLNNLIDNLNALCIIRERRKRMEHYIKTEEQLNKIAHETLLYFNKKLKSKSKKIRSQAARNIVNIVLPRIREDTVIKKIHHSLSNKNCKDYCKKL